MENQSIGWTTQNRVTIIHNRNHGVTSEDGKLDDLGDLARHLVPGKKIIIWTKADQSFVLENEFLAFRDGRFYFKRWEGALLSGRRSDKRGYPFQFRGEMAVPWNAVVCLALYRLNKKTPWEWSGKYAGLPEFTKRVAHIIGSNNKTASTTISKLMGEQQ